jgi:hypothetical protein
MSRAAPAGYIGQAIVFFVVAMSAIIGWEAAV